MKPVISSHLDYRQFLNGVGEMYRINWRSKPPAVREIYLRFRDLDLSDVDRIMQDQYSNHGAESRPPSCMLCSLLLMIMMNVVSITHWVETLHASPFFAIFLMSISLNKYIVYNKIANMHASYHPKVIMSH